MTSTHAYEEDLAYVHDEGFGHVARNAAAELVKQLHAIRIREGLVVDLGCGTGILAEQLAKAGFDVLGFDVSEAALKIARQRAPKATFHHESFVRAELPVCAAVTAVGEVFNFLFDPQNSPAALAKVIKRVHRALAPGGLFLFDLVTLGLRTGINPLANLFQRKGLVVRSYAHKKIAGAGFSRARLRPFARSESCIGGVKRHTGSGSSEHIRCFPSCAMPVLSSACSPVTAIYH